MSGHDQPVASSARKTTGETREAIMTSHNIISVSGGKDSAALLLLAIERQPENLRAVFADTGNEHESTYDYVRYLEQATGVPIRWVKADFSERVAGKREYVRDVWPVKGVPEDVIASALAALQPTGNPFLDLCIWKGRFPSTKARFCSEELKRNPIIEQVQMPLMDAGCKVVSWQGARADESAHRAALPELDCSGRDTATGGELWNYRPILQWTAADCFAMHRKHGIRHNPLYAQGMGRVGCMPCIHARKDELLEISRRFPEAIERLANWERIVSAASKQGASTFFNREVLGPGFQPANYFAAENIWQAVEWAKTGKGGRNFDLFRGDGMPVPACSSIYGLCE